MHTFNPPFLLRNKHIQSILASTGPRRIFVKQRAKKLITNSNQHIIHCGPIDDEADVRLQGEYTHNTHEKGLVILIHGWLGSHESLYLLSAGSHLYEQGYSIFRLNLRDHGNSGHLNHGIFNSTRIDEVVSAIKKIQDQFPHNKNFLAGFSLGGNFSLRVAIRAPDNHIALNKVVAICPVINPYNTNKNLNNGSFIYHHYFRDKWKASLRKKLIYFPEYRYEKKLEQLKTLDEMNDFFVPTYTKFKTAEDYLMGYSVTENTLEHLSIPCHIVSTEDDPVIEIKDLYDLPKNNYLTSETIASGGHCGFIENLSMNSWIDQRIDNLFQAHH